MTRQTKTNFRHAREKLENALQDLRFQLDNIIDELHESIDDLKSLEISDEADSTESITFKNYVNDCSHKMHEYENLLLQIMEKTL